MKADKAREDELSVDEASVSAYKDILREAIEIRPSGLRKKISDAIGTNRSFVSQITNPNYKVPIPPHYIQPIMDVCHLSPLERARFLDAYLAVHPAQAALVNGQQLDDSGKFTIDLSAVGDTHQQEIIRHTLRTLAETMISMTKT